MKKIIRIFFLDLIIGALSRSLFYSFYGVIAAYSIEKIFIYWIKSVPNNLRQYAIFFHFLIQDIICAIPIIAFSGIFLGLIIKKSPLLHSAIVFLGVILFDTIYFKYVLGDLEFIDTNFHLYILKSIIWIIYVYDYYWLINQKKFQRENH